MRLNMSPKLQLKLLIVGDGPERANLERLAGKNFANQIVFKGQLVDGVSEIFLSADIFVLPGLGGLAVSDSLLHGLPVIASIGDGCEVDLLSEGAGIIDEDLNAETLAGHLNKLMHNRGDLEKMQERAHWTIEHKYNIERYMESMTACIKHTMESSNN